MKALWCGATALALVAAVSLSPAMAQGPRPSGGTTVPAANATATTPHYEWQYHYAGRHARWQRDWVLVR
jgi:hypothetical protein